MACIILTDDERGRSILFDTVSETPLNHQAFLGPDSREEAENFYAWLDNDPRRYTVKELDAQREAWVALAYDADENFVGVTR